MSVVNGVVEAKTVAKSGVVLMGRILGADGSAVTQASLIAVSYKVTDLTTGDEGETQSLTVSAVIFDTLQTGSGWNEDSTGFSFRAVIPASQFVFTPNDSPTIVPHKYQVDVRFTPTSGEQFVVPWVLMAHPVWI
jgi:hypothetical protein